MSAENTSVLTATPTGARELVITRFIDAPRELVFQAWTDARHVAEWWGPECFTNPVCEVDARPGGELYIVMRDPGGNDYPMKGVFQEVIEAEKLSFTNIAVGAEGQHLLEGFTTVLFADEAGRTKLTLQTGATGMVDFAEEMLKGMEAGWNQSLVKLDEFLAKTQS
jgi:uncharacterized protein YndB with AHSA1/START domain